MKLSHTEQQRLFDEGRTLVGADGIRKKTLKGDWTRGIGDCLGFGNPNGIWFYGACYFPEDEDLVLE